MIPNGTRMTMNPFLRPTQLLIVGLSVASATHTVRAQDLGLRGEPQSHPIAIVDAFIEPVSGPSIDGGWILFDDGYILSLGSEDREFSDETMVVDGSGLSVYPGMIHPYSRLGLSEISAVDVSRDYSEYGSMTPEVYAKVAINPDSTLYPVARANGILLAASFPSGGRIAGHATVTRTDGWTIEDMSVVPDAGLVVSWPNLRPITASWMSRSPADQRKSAQAQVVELREFFDGALAYFEAKEAQPAIATDPRFEGIRPLFAQWCVSEAPSPLMAMAQDYEQIASAMDFAQDYGIGLVIVGGREAHLIADQLRANDVSVIILGTHRLPKRDDSAIDEAWKLPLQLHKAKVHWCLASVEMHGNERNLPYHAAAAVAHGLPVEAALRSITLSAAETFGVSQRYGSLEAGKSATLIVTDGNPLEITTQILHAFIDGRQVELKTKQTDLRDKYQQKYRLMEGSVSSTD